MSTGLHSPLAGSRVPGWLRSRDPDLAALRRGGRVTVAGCVGFYAGRYLLDDSTFALYAVFAAIALGTLSDVTGTPAHRTRAFLGALPAGLGLVMLGTLLAVDVWAAAAGMLVVGFGVAYASVGGPRLAGLANGLQLTYILPCFPPYDPGSLPSRLAGLAVGVVLMAAADRLLWPAPAPRDFADRLATAAGPLAAAVHAVSVALHGPGGPDPDALATAVADGAEATRDLQLGRVPRAERPTGPGVRDRSLTVAAVAMRSVAARIAGLTALLDRPDVPVHPATAELVAAVARALDPIAAALSGTGPPPELEPLDAALAEFLDRRAHLLGGRPELLVQCDLRVGAAAVTAVQSARSVVVAVRAAVGAAPPEAVRRGTVAPATFSYLALSAPQRWWRRLRVHLTPRSVYFQNAVRLAAGLAVARVVADVLDVGHGFWVLLATLTLMRTSRVAGRAALGPAFVGCLAGAVVAGVLLTAVGDHTGVYFWTLPLLMAVGLAAGQVFGPAAGQAGFTVLVAVLFALVAPATWRLAETRLVDVVLGGLVGALIGAAVWPRGGAGEVRRSAAAMLRAGATDVGATVRRLLGASAAPVPHERVAHLLTLFDATHAQYRAEGSPDRAEADVDWLTVLGVGHRLVDDADLLCGRYPGPGPLPWPAIATALDDDAGRTAAALTAAADALGVRAGPPPDAGPALHARLSAHPPVAPYGQDPPDALRVVDVWGWLHGLANDLSRLHRALERPRPR